MTFKPTNFIRNENIQSGATTCRLHAVFRTFSCTRVLPEIQLRKVQQGNRMLMWTVTCQRVRPQLSVRDRAMTSTTADHDHNVFARIESRHSAQTTVQLMVILGYHDGSHNSRISTNVCSQALAAVGIIELSAVDHPY